MNSWDWFKQEGDALFSAIALIALVLQGDTRISPEVMHWIVDAGVICSLLHQRFFPNAPALPAKVTL